MTNVSPFTPILRHASAFLSYLEYVPLSTKKFKSFQWHHLFAGFYDIVSHKKKNPVPPEEMEKKSTWNSSVAIAM